MAAATGFWNHSMMAGQMTAGQTLSGQNAAMAAPASASPATGSASTASGSSGSSGSSDSSSTVSANDFLTLLVTEMKNQDPTANTDPNEYINQLVQVNSLEQLIDINQNLTTALGGPSSGSSNSPQVSAGGGSPGVTGLTAANAGAQLQGAARNNAIASTGGLPAVSGAQTASAAAAHAAGHSVRHAPGNLGIPDENPAATRVAHSLNGRPHTPSLAGKLSGGQ
ncbi:MAG: flagellar hook capping FlgD N-terminal domain-containing protein [Terracidiphilus sp.]